MSTHHHLGFFETMHADPAEPFDYPYRGAEIVRHATVLRLIHRWAPRNLLEIGCSAGVLTQSLATLGIPTMAIDLSAGAVARARRRNTGVGWAAGSVLQLPFRAAGFDVVLASDGPMSWYLDETERATAYDQIREVLRPGGRALITEYLRPRRFDAFVREIAASGLRIVSVRYLYDRPWYQLERWLRHLPDSVSKPVIRSPSLARTTAGFARVFGHHAAHHIFVAAER